MEQNSIPFITQDFIGQMWFATKNGVVRYDGKKYYFYKHDPKNYKSIGGNFVEQIYVAKDSSIWIGTEPAILSKYNTKTDDFSKIEGVSGDRIKGITQDKNNLYWITSNTTLYSYDDVNKELKSYQYKNIGLDRLLYTNNDELFITTNETFMLKFNFNNKTFTEIPLITKEEKKQYRSTASYSAYLLTQGHEGYIWITTTNGFIIRYNPKNNKIKRYTFEKQWKIEDRLTAMFIFEDNEYNLWIGTWFKGLYKISANRKDVLRIKPNKNSSNSLSNSIVHSGFQDKAGYLWFGHEFSGIDILKGKDKFTIIAGDKNGLPSVDYISIVKDINGTIWVGTAVKGLYYSDKKTPNKFIKSNIIPDIKYNWVNALLSDSKGFLWIGTNQGLFKYSLKNGSIINYKHNSIDYNSLNSNNVIYLHEDKNNIIWIGTNKGLTKFNPNTEKFYRFMHDKDNPKSLSNNFIKTIYSDNNNDLWIGTFNGLNKFNKKTGDFTIYKQDYKIKNSIPANRINTIFQKDDNLWIGSYEGGLTKYNLNTKTFKTYSINDGLPDNNVKNIIDDNSNNLWITTTNKISKFNLTTQQFTTYDKTDGLKNSMYVNNIGLQDLEFYSSKSYKDKQGNIYFAGISGIVIFHPDSLSINQYKPPTVISKFFANGKPISIHKSNYIFKPNINHLEFDLTSINFIQPEKNKIAYFLKGYDSIWNYNNSNYHIEYTNITKGIYTFLYKGSNNDGVWNEKPNSIEIKILPYFYETKSFYLLIFLLLLVLILMLFWYKKFLKKQFQQQKQKLKYTNSSLKKEDIMAINKKLITCLNDKKPYFEADLTLFKLAELLEVKPHNLSQVINQYHKCSFHEFINRYRIKEAKNLLITTVLKIEAVAYDSGFNSTSTFNASFKKETGITPSKFRKENS